jgi:cell fate regulator YaaT (PSP1 superfamily)
MSSETYINQYISTLPNQIKEKTGESSRLNCLIRNGEEIKKQIQSAYAEIEFKGNIRRVCYNFRDIHLNVFQYVVVMTENCEEVGVVMSLGKEAEAKKGSFTDEELTKIMRIASNNEIERYKTLLDEEEEIVKTTKELAQNYNLDIKVTEALWQYDKQKLTIFFTAPQRVDFRELVKDLARSFRTRIELRQISAREETKRLGPCVGPCGRELCCTSFLNDFDHITLDDAKYQQLSNNISKLSGNCGRLKCCLKYELETYESAYKKFPPLYAIVDTNSGVAKITKIDIFKNKVTLNYEGNTKYEILDMDSLNELVDAGKVYMPTDVDVNCNGCGNNGQNKNGEH